MDIVKLQNEIGGSALENQREFNIEGPCIPELHYMADTSRQLAQICKLVNRGKYFTINRARQFGKTTTLSLLERRLIDEYIVLNISFEGYGDKIFQSEELFIREFERDINNAIAEQVDGYTLLSEQLKDESYYSFKRFGERITVICKSVNKPIVLLIDEVDKSSNNQLFLNLLGTLRNKYIQRNTKKKTTFQSVILAGVYDIKNIKLKLRPEEKATYTSPWNIAADFIVDMSLSSDEIVGMLREYEADYNTGMDITAISNEIHLYTNGYPFLVSAICKLIDERLNKEWTIGGIHRAIKIILIERNTLFDDIIKNLKRHDELYEFIHLMLIEGVTKSYNVYNSSIDLGLTFGLFKLTSVDTMSVSISNRIFEIMIYEYLISEMEDKVNFGRLIQKNQFIAEGKLDMKLVLERFQALMKAEYRSSDDNFIEQNGRLLFLCFLKPIINGTGHYAVEPQTRENTRMDIDVFYGNEEFIIELKIWHGENMLKEAEQQLYGYLDSRSVNRGYLVCFSFNKDKEQIAQWTTVNGKDIFEVIV